MRRTLAALVFALSALALTPSIAHADQAPVYTQLLSRVALNGYDPVAYFTDGRAVRGSNEYRLTHQGYEYRFDSAEHLAAFRANPARYLPQYGGYCAWAVSQGYTADIDPEAWTIDHGRLFLNYSLDVQKKWAADIPGNVAKGDGNWPKLLAGD